ncbi:ATP-binding protein [Agromyces sp. NPDC004153]
MAPVLVRAAVEGLVVNDATDEPSIRTPDRLLRIFVSSTLRELGPERKVARRAIERLHLAPVMFELGARPHPPRELYRSYLAQSDVFVGVYWQEYGWIAPGEDISGLEDEYRLAPRAMPKLIYVKQPAERQARLAALIERIREDDTASYVSFGTPGDLERLIEADLAGLLAERFDASRIPGAGDVEAIPAGPLPVSSTDVVGRDADVASLRAWIGAADGPRLVTLVGAGGIGKTRLAIEVARGLDDRFDRITFVALEHVREDRDILPAVARAFGVRDVGEQPLLDRLAAARSDRRDLIVLDNFEQIVSSAPLVARLLTALPDATVLVTSRMRLRLRDEQVFDVDPLGLPAEADGTALQEIVAAPAVRLFRDRARAADPRFDVTEQNAAAVTRICRVLGGVPLAIELAATRIRVLTPEALVARLDRVLPVLATGARDVPERQQTIRATVEWSIDLLSADAQALFTRLGVFSGDFSLDAIEAVVGGTALADGAFDAVVELVDCSLLRQHDHAGIPFFSMLVPVREIATARLEHEPDAAAARQAHADHYVRLAAEIEPKLRGGTQLAALDRLEAERDNIRSGYRHLIDLGETEAVVDAVWRLLLYWWIRNLLPEAKAWMGDVLRAGVPLADRTRAIANAISAWVSLLQPTAEIDLAPIEESVELFHDLDDAFGEGCSLTVLSIACTYRWPPDLDRAEALQRRAVELVGPELDPTFNAFFRSSLGTIELYRGNARGSLEVAETVIAEAAAFGDRFVESIALTNAGWGRLGLGEARPELFMRGLELSLQLGFEDGNGYALEGLAACAALRGDIARSGLLLGAAEASRTRTGMADQRARMTHAPFVQQILASEAAEPFEAARADGRVLSRAEALDLALDERAEADR